jgi:hypothetical protein
MGKPVLNDKGEIWKVKVEGRTEGTPVLTQDTLYVSTDRGFIFGIDLAKAKVAWTYRTEAPKGITPTYSYYAIRAPLAVSDGKLYIVGDDGTLSCMAPTAPDDEGPTISFPKPTRGGLMNGAPPIYFSAYMWDEGTGVNPDTIEVLVDGVPVDISKEAYNERVVGQRQGWVYDPIKRQIRWETQRAKKGEIERPLLNGVHTIQIQAAVWRGNVNSLEWTFVVDNAIPRNATLVKPKATGQAGVIPQGQGQNGPGTPGAYGTGGPGGSAPGYGPGGPGGQGQQGGVFRGRFGNYRYNNRGQGGYGFGQQGGYGGFGGGSFSGGRGGFGGGARGGGFGGRGGRGGY